LGGLASPKQFCRKDYIEDIDGKMMADFFTMLFNAFLLNIF